MSESNWKNDGYNPEEHEWWKATLDDKDNLGYPTGYYYADTMRAIMVAFTKFFNDVYVIRYDEHGYPRKSIRVPIKFGPRSKSHDFRKEEESGETYYIPLPNMYYKFTGFQYDSTRAASSNSIRTFYENYLLSKGIEEGECQLLWEDTQPVPYNITFEMSAKVELFADLLQIIEQISSRFNPDAFLFIKEFWFMNIRRDIKMKLDSVSIDFQDEFGEQDKRELEAKFSFTIEGQVYTKIEHGAIIDRIIAVLNPAIAVYKDGSDVPDRYKSMIDVSGNYREEPGTYDPDTNTWQGSMTDRYDFANVTEESITNSGRKDFLNSANEKVDTQWASRHTIEDAQ